MPQGVKLFTNEMVEFLRQNAKGKPNKVLTDMLNEHFGTSFTYLQVQSCRCSRKIPNGLDGCFRKGHTPFNAGIKMSEETREKCQHTWFKKGQKPYSYREIGSTRIMKGYLEEKVELEKYKSGSGKKNIERNEIWIPKQQKVWIDHNGDIPPKHKIVFLDGDRTNFDINNLACVSDKIHVRMCQNHRYLKNRDLTETMLNITELEKKIRDKSNHGGK